MQDSDAGTRAAVRAVVGSIGHSTGGVLLARWEHFDHDTDVGIRGIGVSREHAFEQAAMALTAVITDPDQVLARHRIDVSCNAIDDESLLVGWLNALVYQMTVRGILFGRFHVSISPGRLDGSAWGEPITDGRHQPVIEMKGGRLSGWSVAQGDDGLWRAQTVLTRPIERPWPAHP